MNFTLFDTPDTPPKNDATPLAGGAGVNGLNSHSDSNAAGRRMTPALRHDAPDTSREAARRIAGHMSKQRAAVLAFITSQLEHGATDSEIAERVGIPIQSVNPRRGELAVTGAIVLNGKRRLTPSGCPARVWVVPAFIPKVEGGAKP